MHTQMQSSIHRAEAAEQQIGVFAHRQPINQNASGNAYFAEMEMFKPKLLFSFR